MAAEEFWDVTHPYHWQELPQVSFLYPKSVCHDKSFCCDKIIFVATNICHDKFYCDKHVFVKTFVMTSIFLLFCHDKHVFVTTKMILVAAPANDAS